jgi:hypothetical protein
VGAARAWAMPPHGVGSLWPSSGSHSFFGPLPGKIRLLELVSSNSENISGKLTGYLGFSCRGVFIGEGASSEVDRGGHTHRGRSLALCHAALLCGPLVAPLHLLFGSLEASVNFWIFGFCFIQFREYFLCSFSETLNSRKQGTGTVASCQ